MRSAKSAVAVLIASVMLPAATLTAQISRSHPEVDGLWKMDTTKFEKHDRTLAGLVLRVSHVGDTLLIVTDVQDAGRPPVTMMTARYLPEASFRGHASPDTARHVNLERWEGDTLVLRAVESRPDRTLQIEERWAIDASGTTLSRFQHVIDGRRVSQQTLVFTRQGLRGGP